MAIISIWLSIGILVCMWLVWLGLWSVMHPSIMYNLLVLDFTMIYTIVSRCLFPNKYLMLSLYFLQNWILQAQLIHIVLEIRIVWFNFITGPSSYVIDVLIIEDLCVTNWRIWSSTLSLLSIIIRRRIIVNSSVCKDPAILGSNLINDSRLCWVT